MDIILWICMCMFALIGVAYIGGDYIFARRRGKLTRNDYRIITLYDDPTEVESLLNKCLLRLGWSGSDGVIIIVDMGMGPEALEICGKAMRDMYGAFICGENELPATLRKMDEMLAGKRAT